MQEMAKVVHKNYEKIVDNIMWLGYEYVLKFNVTLNRYGKYGRENYHKEFMYYRDGEPCINIARTFDYFLSIESLKNSESEKVFIMITQQDLYFLKHALASACKWFTASEYQDLFMKKDGKIFSSMKVDSIKITTVNGYMEFVPSIITYGTNQEQEVGVNIYINSDENSTFLSISKLFALRSFIDSFNMYQSATVLINYLQRPELGTGLYDTGFNSKRKQYPQQTSSSKNQPSFFDKVKATKKE